MISYDDALKKVEKELSKLKISTEKLKLLDSLNRIIADDIRADTDQPLFNNASMDGYAVEFHDEINKWKIIGEVTAGGYKKIRVKKGEAVRIMTGSMMPLGADTVIRNEEVIENNGHIKSSTNRTLEKGSNVRLKGEDVKKGRLLIRKNTILNSVNISMAASCGICSVKVMRKLKIGVIATGNELVDIKTKPKKDSVRASNLYSILSAIREMNMEPISFGIARDDRNDIKKRLKTSLKSGIDILLTTGGVSAGKYDMLQEIFSELGVKIKFSGVKIKPGKPIVFGIHSNSKRNILVFGLPGNPVSCYVNFILFVRNVIMKLYTLNENYYVSAILKHDLTKSDNKRHFLRGKIHNKNGVNIVSQIGSQSSANIGGLNSANCLIVQKERQIILRKGSPVECIVI